MEYSPPTPKLMLNVISIMDAERWHGGNLERGLGFCPPEWLTHSMGLVGQQLVPGVDHFL